MNFDMISETRYELKERKRKSMKFAFIIMGDFNAQKDKAIIHAGAAQIRGVSDLDEACSAAKELCAEGISCIELCGTFGESGARKVIEATQNKIPVGYITHLPEQEGIYKKTFSK